MNKKPYEPEMVELYPQHNMIPWIIGIGLPLGIINLIMIGELSGLLVLQYLLVTYIVFISLIILIMMIFLVKILMRGKDK